MIHHDLQVRRADLDRSVAKGLDFLHSQQLAHGEFRTKVPPIPGMREDWFYDPSPFLASLVVYSLSFAKGDLAREMIEKALDFFAAQMEPPGIWRYRTKQHSLYALIPPDLDDTSCISFLFKQHGRPLPPNRALILANRSPGGLFYTWVLFRLKRPFNGMRWWASLRHLLPFPRFRFDRGRNLTPPVPDDINCSINANVLLYLGECAETRPVIDYLVGVVKTQEESECDRWYWHRFAFYYFLSRAYYRGATGLGEVKDEVCQRILETAAAGGSFGNELESALACCALLNFGNDSPALAQGVTDLIERQAADGSWSHVPMWRGTKGGPGFGAAELTTALCLEALLHYRAGEGDLRSDIAKHGFIRPEKGQVPGSANKK